MTADQLPYSRVMSIEVDHDQLADALADFTFAYLITVSDDFRAHTVAVDPVLTGGVFVVGQVGNRTRRNAGRQPDVTLLWPPRKPGGHTLIVDGRAELTGAALRIALTSAVLHRPATPNTPSASGCGDDCVPVAEG
jgi:hypothetical protein